MTASLAVCTIALDEAEHLLAWLESVRQVADQVVLGVDSRTTDGTADLARAHGAQVVPFEWHDSFAEARNVVLDAVRYSDWVLVMDPDERLLPEGAEAIANILEDEHIPDDLDGYTPLYVELRLDGSPMSTEYIVGRVLRATPDLRYQGRVHDEPRYLPMPAFTQFQQLEGGPHMAHLGGDPSVRERRRKDERDTRLLHLRLADNPNDAVALFYLWQMTGDVTYAERALACGPRTLHPDRVTQLQEVLP